MAPIFLFPYFWILGDKYGYFFTALFIFIFFNPHPTLPYPPLRRQFRSDPPLLWPRAVEPFHARQHGNKGDEERGGCRGWGGFSGKGGAVGRRSRLSFQCEEVEGETQQNMCFQMFRKQRNLIHNTVSHTERHTHTHTHSIHLSVIMYSVECKDKRAGYDFNPPI